MSPAFCLGGALAGDNVPHESRLLHAVVVLDARVLARDTPERRGMPAATNQDQGRHAFE